MMRKIRNILSLVMLAVMLCLTGCKNVKDIRITSAKLESVSPRGFKSIDVFFTLGVENPAKQVRISDIDGSLKHSGKVIGKMTMDPFVLTAKSSETYTLKANVSLAQGANFKDIMLLASPDGLNECTVDITAKAAYGKGAPIPVKQKDIPLKELLDTINNEKN